MRFPSLQNALFRTCLFRRPYLPFSSTCVFSPPPYQSAIAHANISSLQARRQELSQKFSRKIVNNPDNPLFSLLPPPREATITARLRSAQKSNSVTVENLK